MNTDTMARSRRTDALTSREAAQSMVMVAATHRALIWNALRTAGPAGRFEISELTGLDPVQVARRVPSSCSKAWRAACPAGRRPRPAAAAVGCGR